MEYFEIGAKLLSDVSLTYIFLQDYYLLRGQTPSSVGYKLLPTMFCEAEGRASVDHNHVMKMMETPSILR